MYTVDLHLKKETVATAAYNLQIAIKMARKQSDKLLCLIVGYGSSGGSHKIKNAIEQEIIEMIQNKQVKGYLMGNELDIFNIKYQKCSFKDRIPEQEKRERNPGKIYVFV